MIPLPLPLAAADDDNYISALCQEPSWSVHLAGWLAAYAAYRQHGGNPWKIIPTTFNPNVFEAQQELYSTRRSGSRMRRIRNTAGLLCCPMCGSSTTGSLDHYLPRGAFAEFSIMAANVVPACSHCNSSGKGNTYRGVAPERFIHPYFDTIAQNPIWMVEFTAPYEAVIFRAVPLHDLAATVQSIVAFHLQHVLGEQFNLMAGRQWATVPQILRNRIGGACAVTITQINAELAQQLRDHEVSSGRNSWFAAFFRGLLADQGAANYLAQKVSEINPTPLPMT